MSRGALAAALVPAAVALVILGVGAGFLWGDLDPREREAIGAVLTPARIGLLVLFGLALVTVLAVLGHRLFARLAAPARRLAEDVRVIAQSNAAHRVAPSGAAELRVLASAVNELAEVRSALAADVAATVADANARVEAERSRLAALIAELDQSVLVCNREGRILLYNAAAQRILGGGDASLLGLGRSVFGIVDRNLILHAVEAMERQLERREREGTYFVTATGDGRLLRVQAAPVPEQAATGADVSGLAGYVLLLVDVTESVDAEAKRVALFQRLVEGTRAGLASIRAASENLAAHPEMEEGQRTRFAGIIQEEAVRLSDLLHATTADASERLKVRWPLEEMRGEDLLTLARSRIERRVGQVTKLESVDPELWLRVDSFSLAQGLGYLARRLQEEFAVREVRFRLLPAGGHAQLDMLWRGAPLASETAFAWQNEPFTLGGEDSPLTLAQVIERHGGETWYQRDLPAQLAYFRLLLPLAEGRRGNRGRGETSSRPEFYDFDLFRRSAASEALDERPLADLEYTVFDTETTGLNPAEGDEIIAIGAVRILNGRVLGGETFESLVDPQRSLPEASVAVHGITRDMLAGQPPIDAVLPRFRRFAEDTVLVGHNAAFDMRFLQLKEAQTGVRFEQPVLDTLLLSAVAHPEQGSHSLEEIAGRLGVNVVGRHTALGDALVTAEVFLRLVPVLSEHGIRTLGEARAAAEKTYYARLKY
ncbi:MAG TPA: exonuclease domain-containing protein [Burkholderiales bacterium]|nr:exonuclease domain-containing protein [Burkholderiales bacterium]